MAQEIELKLALPKDAQRAFLRHPLLRQAMRQQTHRLTNIYYDTLRLALRKRGIALRLRAKGRRWLQTVKCAGEAGGGLSARPEWETPYVGHFDFSGIDDPAVRTRLEKLKLKAGIAPVFETRFQRNAWLLEPQPGTRIEMALDRGWIAAAGRRETISEIELELLQGDPAQLFAIARALAERVPVVPAPHSKADRGYRLFGQMPAAPVKGAAVALVSADPPLAAFRRIALACLDHLQQNHAGALASEDPEYFHQMRVATRRLRAALRLFAPLLPADFATGLTAPLQELMALLGQARDFDVLLAEIVEPVLAALPDESRLAALASSVTKRRFECRQAALAYLRSPRFGASMLAVLEALHGLGPSSQRVGAGGTAHSTENLADFAADRLRRLRRKVLGLAGRARIDDPPSLHALRIGIKRLRYALEFFAPLADAKPVRKLLAPLTELQGTLGQLGDLANAGALLMDCAGSDPALREAVTLIGGWHGPRHQKLLGAVPDTLKRLGKLRLPKFRA